MRFGNAGIRHANPFTVKTPELQKTDLGRNVEIRRDRGTI